MIDLENELAAARDAAALDPQAAARLIAIERREIFSLFGELRAASYVAVLLITTGVGIVVKNNADRIGPMAIIAALAIASLACYGYALRVHLQGRERSIVGDYVLLLGALLASSAVGYAESQFHLLGGNWSRHLLILAAFHAATAYYFDSRLVLTAALTSLAGWFGVEKTLDMSATVGLRAVLCAAVVLVARIANRHRPFDEVYEHFAAILAFAAGIAWIFDEPRFWFGVVLMLATAAAVMWRGIATRSEAFVVYAILGGVFAIDAAVIDLLAKLHDGGDVLIFLFLLVTTPLAIVLLFVTHQKMKGEK